jgi:hypothetical protein
MKISVSIDKSDENDEKPDRSIIYIFINSPTVMKEIQAKTDKYQNVFRKEVLPTVFQKSKLPLDTKVVWSDKAGCSCGCSPGFLITGHKGMDIHVKLS